MKLLLRFLIDKIRSKQIDKEIKIKYTDVC